MKNNKNANKDANKDANKQPSSPQTITDRLAQLKTSVKTHRLSNRVNTPKGDYGYGASMAIEMLAAMVVGVGLGWGLDKWLGTAPWLTIIFGFLGILTGILNIVRMTTPGK